MTQFIACEFKPGGKAYTYRNDGDPVEVGDEVLVPAFRSDGHSRVTVVEIVKEPAYLCKPIVGLAPHEEQDVV